MLTGQARQAEGLRVLVNVRPEELGQQPADSFLGLLGHGPSEVLVASRVRKLLAAKVAKGVPGSTHTPEYPLYCFNMQKAPGCALIQYLIIMMDNGLSQCIQGRMLLLGSLELGVPAPVGGCLGWLAAPSATWWACQSGILLNYKLD